MNVHTGSVCCPTCDGSGIVINLVEVDEALSTRRSLLREVPRTGYARWCYCCTGSAQVATDTHQYCQLTMCIQAELEAELAACDEPDLFDQEDFDDADDSDDSGWADDSDELEDTRDESGEEDEEFVEPGPTCEEYGCHCIDGEDCLFAESGDSRPGSGNRDLDDLVITYPD